MKPNKRNLTLELLNDKEKLREIYLKLVESFKNEFGEIPPLPDNFNYFTSFISTNNKRGTDE